MYTVDYANGQQLQSSALTPHDIQTLFQQLVLQLFGIVVNPQSPQTAYKQVRIAWQKSGSPAWRIDEDCTIISSQLVNEPFARVRDQLFDPNGDISLQQQMGYTRIWKIHFTTYGPDCYTKASSIITGMQLDFARAFLENPPPALYFQSSFDS